MKTKLLLFLALAFTAYVGAMTSDNDSCSCQINQDSVQVSADSAQLSDSLQGYVFDRNIDGWVVISCPGNIITSYTDSCGNAEKLIRRSGKSKNRWELKSPWEKSPNSFGIKRYIKLNGNSDNKQTTHPGDTIPWWIQSCQS